MSYNGVGLSTARGSGTNGFVQRNLSYLKSKPLVKKDISHYTQAPEHQQKTANKEILDHERKVVWL
jgi:serine/arginine repetitive matrix protein 2